LRENATLCHLIFYTLRNEMFPCNFSNVTI
jgi:hypothetical protein